MSTQFLDLQDTYIASDSLPWVPFSAGIDFRLLHASSETGKWTVLFRCAQGSAFARHRHLGAGEYLMLEGRMEVRGGSAAGGITAVAGDYGYEPNGVIHDSTNFVEPTRFFFINHGPVVFIDELNNPTGLVDAALLQEVYAKGRNVPV
jgi:hypothetical protein